MAQTDIIATALFSSFGVWLLIAPVSVIRFYNWFLGGNQGVRTLEITVC